MPSVASPPRRSKPARSCRLYDGNPALLSITEGGKTQDYFLSAHDTPNTYRFRKPLPDGSPGPSLYCAVIVKRVDAQTRSKTSINDLLRE